MARAVLDMNDRRPIWAMPEWVPERIREVLPPGWELLVVDELTDGSGDGAGRVSPRVLEAVSRAEMYFGYGIAPELLEAGGDLRWVHSGAAGVGSSLTPPMRASPVVFTNSAGVHAPPMAETVLAMMLHFSRGLDIAIAAQRRSEWASEAFYVDGAPLRELSDSTIGVVGFGGIGREVARRAAALGARVVGLKRRAPRSGDADVRPVAGGSSLGDRIELLHGAAGLDVLLRRSDFVVVCAPETDETRGMIGADELAVMKRSAVLINVARGRVLDEPALLAALEEGRIRGAGLDVFTKEPLLPEHPLWSLPNVLLTPHVSAVTTGFWARETGLIVRNLERHLRGAPLSEWENVVDKEAGY